MSEKRLVGLVYKVSTPYEIVYEDMSHTDRDFLEKKKRKSEEILRRILDV